MVKKSRQAGDSGNFEPAESGEIRTHPTSESNVDSAATQEAGGDCNESGAPYDTSVVSGAGVDNSRIELTGSISSCDTDSTESGADSMDDPRLEQAFNLIRAVIADADKRAADELVARISGNRNAVSHTVPLSHSPQGPDKRAPHGSSQMLIDRALSEAGSAGLTVAGIMSKAETEFERMVSASAVRNWLKECERKRPPRYRQMGGVWFLADRAPTVKAVS